MIGQFHYCSSLAAAADVKSVLANVPIPREMGHGSLVKLESTTSNPSCSSLRRMRAKKVRNRLWQAASNQPSVDMIASEGGLAGAVTDEAVVEDAAAEQSKDMTPQHCLELVDAGQQLLHNHGTLHESSVVSICDRVCTALETSWQTLRKQEHTAESLQQDLVRAITMLHPLLSPEQLGSVVDTFDSLDSSSLERVCTSTNPASTLRSLILTSAPTQDMQARQSAASSEDAHTGDGDADAPGFKLGAISKRGMVQQHARRKKKR